MRKIKKIIVHVSDSDDSLDFGFWDINNWHRERGFLSPSGISCGYHYIVKKSGEVQLGRPESEMGAHCKGENQDSIGIVWIGRNDCNARQKTSLMAMIKGLCLKHKLDMTEDVYGHGEFNEHKTCPNLDMVKLRAELIFK